MKTRAHGFSLIELSIALVILGILLLAAAPGFSAWMRNTQIRTAAEALRDGLQRARGEAVRRNTSIRFQLTNNLSSDCVLQPTGTASEPNTSWVVSVDDPTGKCEQAPMAEDAELATTATPRIIQKRSADEGSSRAYAVTEQDQVVFTSLGRLATGSAATNFVIRPVADAGCENSRCLCVTVSIGGQVRLCNPALPKKDPQSCFDAQNASATAVCSIL